MDKLEPPMRDARGHFAEWTCTHGHDRCDYPSGDCPYCELTCRKCRAPAKRPS